MSTIISLYKRFYGYLLFFCILQLCRMFMLPNFNGVWQTSPAVVKQSILNTQKFKIDIVYLYAPSNHRIYTQQKNHTQFWLNEMISISNTTIFIQELNGSINYGTSTHNKHFSPTIDHNELRLSLRSVYKYIIKNKYNSKGNWLGNIYIVSNNGISPDWLKANTRANISIIDSRELIAKCIRTYTNDSRLANFYTDNNIGNFNTHSLYLCLHLIENLTEIFIQMDDDFMIGSPINISDIYNKIGQYAINYRTRFLRPRGGVHGLSSQLSLITDICPTNVMQRWATHQPRVWNISKIDNLWKSHPLKCVNTLFHPFRSHYDIDLSSFYPVWQHCIYDIPLLHQKHTTTLTLDSNFTFQNYVNVFQKWLKNSVKFWVLQDVTNGKECLNINSLKYLIYITQTENLWPAPFEKCDSNIFKTKIMGHRGVGFTSIWETDPYYQLMPENTLQNIQFAVLHKNLSYIEIDIASTLDGVIVVHHTHNILFSGCYIEYNRNGNMVVNIGHITFNELQNNSQYWYNHQIRINSLSEILLWAKAYNIHFQIELKQGTNYGSAHRCIYNLKDKSCVNKMNSNETDVLINGLINVIKHTKYPVNKLTISSFEGTRLYNFKQKFSKDINLALITGTNRGRALSTTQQITLINAALYYGLSDISVFHAAVTQQLVSLCNSNGINLQIGMPGGGWCLHEIPEESTTSVGDNYSSLLDALMYNPDYLCTNQPVLAQQILNNITQQCPVFKLS